MCRIGFANFDSQTVRDDLSSFAKKILCTARSHYSIMQSTIALIPIGVANLVGGWVCLTQRLPRDVGLNIVDEVVTL